MTQVKMPETVAYAIAAANTGLWVKTVLAIDAGHEGVDLMDQKYVGRLITTDQAEAYAKARVREALEKAASICEAAYEQGSAEYAVSRNPYFEGGCDAAESIEHKILALIPKEAT